MNPIIGTGNEKKGRSHRINPRIPSIIGRRSGDGVVLDETIGVICFCTVNVAPQFVQDAIVPIISSVAINCCLQFGQVKTNCAMIILSSCFDLLFCGVDRCFAAGYNDF